MFSGEALLRGLAGAEEKSAVLLFVSVQPLSALKSADVLLVNVGAGPAAPSKQKFAVAAVLP
jgi:hypothetical protein